MTLKDTVPFSERIDKSHINSRMIKTFAPLSRLLWLAWRLWTSHESREIDERCTTLRKNGLSRPVVRTGAWAPPLWSRFQVRVLCTFSSRACGRVRQAPTPSPPYPEARPPGHHALWLAVSLRGTLEQVVHALFNTMGKSPERARHLK